MLVLLSFQGCTTYIFLYSGLLTNIMLSIQLTSTAGYRNTITRILLIRIQGIPSLDIKSVILLWKFGSRCDKTGKVYQKAKVKKIDRITVQSNFYTHGVLSSVG